MTLQSLTMTIRNALVIAGVFCLLLTGGTFSHIEPKLGTEHQHSHIGVELAGLDDNHAHMGDIPSKREASGILDCGSKVLAWSGNAYLAVSKAQLTKQRIRSVALRGYMRGPDPPPPRFHV